MTVKQLLASMDSREYSRWIAFEKVFGPIDNQQWNQEILASIHEQLQNLAYIFGQAHFVNEDNPDNPIPAPSKYPRPHEPPYQEPDPEAVDISDEYLPPPEDLGSCQPNCVCKRGKQPPTHN